MININYIREKKLSIVVVLVFILILLLTGAYFLPRDLDTLETVSNKEIDSQTPFGNLSMQASKTKFADAENILYELYANNEEYYKDFDWKTELINAKVLEIDVEEKQVKVLMINPKNDAHKNDINRPTVRCNNETTYASAQVNPHTNVYKSNFDIFTLLEVGDTLHANCLDENCFTIGNFCAFADLNYEN